MFWRAALIVFISNTCIMVIELVAGRILAPILGVSLYTWTSVIGVVLAGISLGNYLGGRLADRAASRLLLGRLFFASSLGTLSVLATALLASRVPFVLSTPFYVLLVTAIVFFLPGVLLGTISPVVLKLTLNDLQKSGRTVGTLYAASTLGNIVGTFATGFYLISLLGTRLILLLVALVLLGTGVLVIEWRAISPPLRRGSALVAIALLATIALAGASGYAASRCLEETNYFCIRIIEEPQENGETVQVLVLDRLVHSTVDPANPRRLDQAYGYEQVFAAVLDMLYPPSTQQGVDTLLIGGGAYVLPRYVEATYPTGTIDVIEIDPAVTRLAETRFGLGPETRIRSIGEDARMALNRMPARATYDVIVGDVFNDFAVPYHLTTREFDEQVARLLRDDGIYLLNVVDGRRGDFLRSAIVTLRAVLPHVYLIPTEAGWQTNARNTFVLVASRHPLPALAGVRVAGLGDDVGQPLSEAALAGYMAAAVRPPTVLRDDFVPTDSLLAPVFRDSMEQ